MNAQKLFGTDGVRGRAGSPPLDRDTVERLGAALVQVLPTSGTPRLLVGRDTRESGPWIEEALARGIHAAGARLVSAGVVPTPAIAYLTRAEGFDAGLVISASHNPYEDNGIKVFSGRGEKFDGGLEAEIEAIVADLSWSIPPDEEPHVERVDLTHLYVEHAKLALPDVGSLAGTPLAIDCANGATAHVAPAVFRDLGFEVHAVGVHPDGRNINLDCGSTHPGHVAEVVRRERCHAGIAFDGDGDRAILVDEAGRIVDGDAVLLMCATFLQSHGRLEGSAVVATVMSNIGLELALAERGIALVRCPVGDKYVMEELARRHLSLGGEQSGHIIFSDFLFTGDGLVTALSVLEVMAKTGRTLDDLAGELVTYPQVLLNVRVARRQDLSEVPPVQDAMRRVEQRLEGQGRLLVRYSGTEPLLRIMIEGKNQDEIRAWAEEIGAAAKSSLG
jgi:phosphoglucosamine mutase